MLAQEATWLRDQFRRRTNAELFPMLNAGSQTQAFRSTTQPWIEQDIFRPLRARGGTVVHTDLQQGDGVDLVGDLLDPMFGVELARGAYRSVLCSNLLEHVTEPARLASVFSNLLSPGGLLFVTGPLRFPYHPDPIDTMLRATPKQLAAFFPNTEVREAAVVSCGTYLDHLAAQLMRSPVATGLRVVKALAGLVASPQGMPTAERLAPRQEPITRLLPWLFKTFTAACVVLQKKE